MPAIRTENLTKRYRDITAVDNLCLTVEQGELYSLLGVNGAGKTTAIKMLTCLSQPTSGDAFIMGHSIKTEPSAVKTLIGVSPQETAVAPNLTVKENIALMCGVHGMNKHSASEKADTLIDKFSLRDILNKRAGKLSGGWQRRLSIAMALVSDPKILFLDEPTLGLDVIARSELWDVIRALRETTTIILTTHYMEEAEALSDRVGIMSSGKLLTVGTVDSIKTATGKDRFEDAFISVVKGAGK